MIHDEIVTYEVAKLAKEKGFPQHPNENNHCDMYCWDGLRNIHPLNNWGVWCMEEYNHENLYAAPTQGLLQRWLREEKCLFANIGMAFNGYYYQVIRTDKFDECIGTQIIEHFNGNKFDTYELALEDALKYALENLV